jgi:hypothetical protein
MYLVQLPFQSLVIDISIAIVIQIIDELVDIGVGEVLLSH